MNEILSSPVLVDSQALILRLALAGVCVSALLLIVARLLRRRSDPLQYGVLFGGGVGLLAIPALVGLGQWLSLPIFPSATPPEVEVLRVPLEMLPELLHRPLEAQAIEEPEAPSIIGPLAITGLGLLWVIGFAFGLARLVYAVARQKRAFHRQAWHADFWTDELKAKLAQHLGLKQFPRVDSSPVVPMPMVIGIWRPTIVLPTAAPASWGQTQWEAVLLHEAAHIARGDHWAALLQRLAVLLYWWCPLVYPLSRRLNELRENICDDYALQGHCDPIAYAELLVESAERLVSLKVLPVSLALLDSAHGGLESRITRLLAKEKRTMTKLSLCGKLLGAGFLAAVGMLTMAATAYSGGAQATPGKKVQIKIIIDGKEIDISEAKIFEHIEAVQRKDVVIVKEIPKDGVGGIHFIQPLPATPAQADPRVEALVKEAEAIKPGSGATIRKALQGTPAKFEAARTIQYSPDGRIVWEYLHQAKPAAPTFQFTPVTGDKKVIILQIEDGKALQLNDADLKKLIEKGMRFDFRLEHPLTGAAPKAVGKKEGATFEVEINRNTTPKAVDSKSSTQSAADLEALRRQLERLTADLNLLRQQLNAGSKKETK